MNIWPKTIGFAVTLPSAAWIISIWCHWVHMHFLAEHPGATGGHLARFYWHFSWVGIIAAVLLSVCLVWLQFKKSLVIADVIYYFGIWLFVMWCGIALVAMEQPFVPWLDLRGAHY